MKPPCFQQKPLFIFLFEEKINKTSLPQVAFSSDAMIFIFIGEFTCIQYTWEFLSSLKD